MASIANQIIVDTPQSILVVPAGLPLAGAVLKVYVNGVVAPFSWTAASQVTLRAAAPTRAIIDFESEFDVNEATVGAEASLNFPSIPAATTSELTIANVRGAVVGDVVSLGTPAGMVAGLMFMAFVSATGVVTVRAANVTAGAIDPPAATFRVAVSKA